MLIKCKECGKLISDKAEICVGCGFPIQQDINLVKQKYREFLNNFSCIDISDENQINQSISLFENIYEINYASIMFDETAKFLKHFNEEIYNSFMLTNGLQSILISDKDEEFFKYNRSGLNIEDNYEQYSYFWFKKFGEKGFTFVWALMKLFLFCGIGCERNLDLALKIDVKIKSMDCSTAFAGFFMNDNCYAKYLVAVGYLKYLIQEHGYGYRCACIYPLYDKYDYYYEAEEYQKRYDEIEDFILEDLMKQAAKEGCIEAKYWQIMRNEEYYQLSMDSIHDSYEMGLMKGATDDYIKNMWQSTYQTRDEIVEGYQELIKNGYIEYAFLLDKFVRSWYPISDKSALYYLEDGKPVAGKYNMEDIKKRKKYIPDFIF